MVILWVDLVSSDRQQGVRCKLKIPDFERERPKATRLELYEIPSWREDDTLMVDQGLFYWIEREVFLCYTSEN